MSTPTVWQVASVCIGEQPSGPHPWNSLTVQAQILCDVIIKGLEAGEVRGEKVAPPSLQKCAWAFSTGGGKTLEQEAREQRQEEALRAQPREYRWTSRVDVESALRYVHSRRFRIDPGALELAPSLRDELAETEGKQKGVKAAEAEHERAYSDAT